MTRRDWPSEDAFGAGVDRLLGASDCDFLLASRQDGAPAEAVCQLRFHFGLWRGGQECILEDLYVRERARRRCLGSVLLSAALEGA